MCAEKQYTVDFDSKVKVLFGTVLHFSSSVWFVEISIRLHT